MIVVTEFIFSEKFEKTIITEFFWQNIFHEKMVRNHSCKAVIYILLP